MKNQATIENLKDKLERIDISTDINSGEIISVEKELFDVKNNRKINDWRGKKIKNNAFYSSMFRIKNKKKQRFNISYNQLNNIKDCSNFLDFRLFENNEKKLVKTNFCRNRFCPICVWRKSLKISYDNSRIINTYLEQSEKNRLLFLTLTIKNCEFDKLKQTIQLLNKSFNNLKRRKEFKNVVSGTIKVIEITVNKKEKTFHPHLHIICSVKEDYFNKKNAMYIEHGKWAEMWKECLKSDTYVFANVKAVKKNKSEEAHSKAIQEISKYVVKDCDYLIYKKENDKIKIDEELTDEILFYLYTQTKYLRFLDYAGIFREIKKDLEIKDFDELSNDELINTHDEYEDKNSLGIIVRYCYSYSFSNYFYKEFLIEPKEDN